MLNRKTGSRIVLLNRIAVADFADQPLNVSTLMAMRDIASPATIHRKMVALVDEEWVDLVSEPDNRRIKYLRLTSKALLFYREREKLMLAAIVE